MSIQELTRKFKGFLSNTEYLLAILIVGVSLVSFGLGRFSAERDPGFGTNISELQASAASATPAVRTASSSDVVVPAPQGGYVASKNGTKYHLPWCSGAKQMSEQNKIFFNTKEEAEAAGYTPASNCKRI